MAPLVLFHNGAMNAKLALGGDISPGAGTSPATFRTSALLRLRSEIAPTANEMVGFNQPLG